ncbi:MAG: hypothetical protein WKI04_12920 [Ferruginibacter sp.]
MRFLSISKFMPAIAWFFLVLILICLPGKNFSSPTWLDKIHLDKWIHMGIFGLLALLFMLPVAYSPIQQSNKIYYFIAIAAGTSLWGLMTDHSEILDTRPQF